jgi:chromosome segregation ATPase
MNEPSNDSPEQNLASLVSEAQQLIEQIKEVKTQSEEQFKAAELARKNADSESLFAFNAKVACEGHATAIANLKGSVEAEVNSIVTNKQKSDELLAAVNAGKATVDVDIKVINDRRKEADQSAIEVIKAAEGGTTRLKDIETVKTSAEASLKSINEATAASTQSSVNADAANRQAQKSSADAVVFTSTISEYQKATRQNAEEILALLAQAQTAEESLKKVLEHLAKSDEISTSHEQRVENLSVNLAALIERVEGLLPGATSAGLASAFNKQRARFVDPQRQWLRTFVGCIVGLVIVATPSFLSAIGLGPKEET